MKRLPFVDLSLDSREQADAVHAITRVMQRGWYVLGPEVEAFEYQLAATIGVEQAVGVGSGTDALILGLRSLGIGPGDEVIIPAFTAFPTAAAVLESGAKPVIVDVEEQRPLLDLDRTMDAVSPRTRAVILVHLYGASADARAFASALNDVNVVLIEDCAQAQGASLPTGEPVGSVGRFGAFSFYPTKNLAALGDAGALVTSDPTLAAEVRSWRSHGERDIRYVHHLPARNSRLDDIHAAVLRSRLTSLPARLQHARDLSAGYLETLPPEVGYVDHGTSGAPHLAVIRVPAPGPDRLAKSLNTEGIATGRHYPLSLSDQPVLAPFADAPIDRARKWASSCLSLPLHHRMSLTDIERVADAVAAHVDH